MLLHPLLEASITYLLFGQAFSNIRGLIWERLFERGGPEGRHKFENNKILIYLHLDLHDRLTLRYRNVCETFELDRTGEQQQQ